MTQDSLEDELPELSALLGRIGRTSSISTSKVRRSPRKKPVAGSVVPACTTRSSEDLTAPSRQTRRSTAKQSPLKENPRTLKKASQSDNGLKNIPLLPRGGGATSICASSNNRSSPRKLHRSTKISYVDSLPLSLSRLSMQEETSKSRAQSKFGSANSIPSPEMLVNSMMTEDAKPCSRKSPRKTNPMSSLTSHFVLKEARCNDDDEDSGNDDEDEEQTDLSDFIVDDNAELSYHESSETESDKEREWKKRRNQFGPRQRLHRGTRRRLKSVSDHLDLTKDDDDAAPALHGVNNRLTESPPQPNIEVIDLTLSPEKALEKLASATTRVCDPFVDDSLNKSSSKPVTRNLFDDFDRILRLSPPKNDIPVTVPAKLTTHDSTSMSGRGNQGQGSFGGIQGDEPDRFTTPPATPPRPPSKLKSPSKLLSPSKFDATHRSAHRQSTDAFWDLNTVNNWHDLNSPKKAPATSPRKKGLARFHIWSDDSEDDMERVSDSSLPSPCSSPTKPKLPLKGPEKAERRRLVEEKNIAKAKKNAFDSVKKQLAQDLLNELDQEITSGKLSTLAVSTGGVHIKWSKTLRSTAGRANWRRTVTKNSGSPIKGNISEGPGVKVEHFANIELAEKVIDSEDRLVNTLAHEFCHLANFMVSNIRDQPHGASFKSWAAKVTKHLRNSENELWKKVQVTTKHDYKIEYKFVWACMGREKSKAMEFLNLEDDEGCGAEYGRHSKSIDTEKSRCGRCKGRLVQVRPKPRASPVKKPPTRRTGSKSSEGDEAGGGSGKDVKTLESMVEVVEISD